MTPTEPTPSASLAEMPVVTVAYGGGTNSTAMLCGFRERGIVPALICFADTGGEHQYTYDHVALMSEKCREWWGIEIMTVRKLYRGEPETLEAQCLRTKQLPSLAYGYKQCSIHFKRRPQEKYVRKWMRDNRIPKAIKAVGFGADEPSRVKAEFNSIEIGQGLTLVSRYYLVEWGWGRRQCVETIKRHGIEQPGKSACFFCPSKKVHEVLRLRRTNSGLFGRGVAMEDNTEPAKDGSEGVRGLHFGTKWSDMAAADDAQLKLFEWVGEHASPKIPCGCYDG